MYFKGSQKNDLQTEADRSAQKCIVGSLSKLFPGVTIIGEEGPHNASEEVCCLLITQQKINYLLRFQLIGL